MSEVTDEKRLELSRTMLYVVHAATAARESYLAGEWASVAKSLRSVKARAAAALALMREVGGGEA